MVRLVGTGLEWSKEDNVNEIVELCRRRGVDISNDSRAPYFWNILVSGKATLYDEVLAWLGFKGDNIVRKKQKVTQILNREPKIRFIKFKVRSRTMHHIINYNDFKDLLSRVNTDEVDSISVTLSTMEEIHSIIKNTQLVNDQYSLSNRQRPNSEGTVQSPGIIRRPLEDITPAQTSSNVANAYNIAAGANSETLDLLSECELKLRTTIKPTVVPEPINKKKIHFFGIYLLENEKVLTYYMIRRQKENYTTTAKRLFKKHDNRVREVKLWKDVSHSVDVGNRLKKKLNGKGNTITFPGAVWDKKHDLKLIEMVGDILDNNEATKMADDIHTQVEIERLSLGDRNL